MDLKLEKDRIIALLNKYSKTPSQELINNGKKAPNNEINSVNVNLYNEKYNEVIFELIEKY